MKQQKLHWYHHWIAQGALAPWKRTVKALNSKGSYCFGDSLTMADICLIPQVYNARRFDCPLQGYPIICAIYDHCHQMPAFSAASPEAQSDYPAK